MITIKNKRLFSAILTICLVWTLQAQSIQIYPTKLNANINYERLKRIDNVVNDFVAKKYIAGAVTIVVKDGQLIQHKGYGYVYWHKDPPQ